MGQDTQASGGDLADAPPGPRDAFVRRDRIKPGTSFSPMANRDQPSAWARSLLYGGGLGVLAFALAAGWTAGRPTPRRHTDPKPALASLRNGQRYR